MVVPCLYRNPRSYSRNYPPKTMENHILISNARVIDLGGPFNGKRVSIRIIDGVITEIGKALKPKKAEVWSDMLRILVALPMS